ncbi:MAG TPA: penicillin-binding protein 2 [Candidatus Dormibacteraeota bacterium]|nr:penicillin-binding protein 2 [Candidatus Dormibacteraeota bacterium]
MKNDKPLFGYAGEDHPRSDRMTIKRDQRGNERWADAILPADAAAGVLETPTSRQPLGVIAAVVVLLFSILVVQLFRLQIIGGERNLSLAEGNRIRQKIVRAPRGVVYDRHKIALAKNLASSEVTVVPSLLPREKAQRQAVYARVAELTGVPEAEIAAKAEGDCINRSGKTEALKERAQQICLLQNQPQLITPRLAREKELRFDEAILTVPGFSIDVNPIREYLDGGSLAAILGYTGRVSPEDLKRNPSYISTDLVGKLGIERQYEDTLRGRNGSEQAEVDSGGRPVKLLTSKRAEPGQNIMLSIDWELQKKLAESIAAQLTASGSKRGAGIAMHPRTGEILAAVNLPTYDNNLFAKGISAADYKKLTDDPGQPLFNKLTAGAYPSGSIIKPLVAAAALQEKVVGSGTTVNDSGQLEITNRYDPNVKYTFRSYEPGGLGVVNLVRALALSSNVYFYTVGGGYGNIKGLGVDRLVSYYHKFGLGQKPEVDIPEQSAGRVPTPEYKKRLSGESWVLGDSYNIAVGQGDMLVSPLQMAVAISAIANGGDIIRPHFFKASLDGAGNPTATAKSEVVRKGFIDPQHLATVREGMRQAVTTGTACCLIEEQVPVPVAAKTGTAETDPEGKRAPHAWFEAFAPYNDPQIVIVVLIENSGEGAQYAAPAVRDTLAWCFKRPQGCVK